MEFCVCKRSGEGISSHQLGGYIGEINLSNSQFITDIAMLNVNVLGPRMEDRVVS